MVTCATSPTTITPTPGPRAASSVPTRDAAEPVPARLRLGRGGEPLRHRDGLVGGSLLRLSGVPAPDGSGAGLVARSDHRRVLARASLLGARRAAGRPVDRPPRRPQPADRA